MDPMAVLPGTLPHIIDGKYFKVLSVIQLVVHGRLTKRYRAECLSCGTKVSDVTRSKFLRHLKVKKTSVTKNEPKSFELTIPHIISSIGWDLILIRILCNLAETLGRIQCIQNRKLR